MVAITVKYHGPTNYRGSRWSAEATANKKRVFLSQDDALGSEENKDRAALELCKKMNWIGNLVKGETKDATVYVFDYEYSRVVNPEVDRISSTEAEKEYNRNSKASQLGNR